MENNKWQLLSVSSRAIMPSRWKTLWNYVIRGRIPEYTVEAWVSQGKYMDDLKLHLNFIKGVI